MNYSKTLPIFFGLILLSTLLFSQSALAKELDHYTESNTTCVDFGIIAGDLSTGLTISDGTDFEFVQDESYLLTITSDFGGANSNNEVGMKVLHGSTVFEGSENIMEVSAQIGSCSTDFDLYNYFWFTVWTPSTVGEASEDIVVEFESIDGTNMTYDNVVVTVIHLDDLLVTENQDWFFNEVFTDDTLTTTFSTSNNATLSFTPLLDNTNYFILGTTQLDTGVATVQYESRLNIIGQDDVPLNTQEGEDPTSELFVQSIARVVTFQNGTEQMFSYQARIDAVGGGIQERLYSSLFALNIDIFDEQAFSFVSPQSILEFPEFVTLVASESFTVPINNTDVFIMADIGTKDTVNPDKVELRVQVDNVDLISGITGKSYDYNNDWDATDILRWNMHGIFNADNSTHTVDVDGSQTDDGEDAQAIYKSLIIFSLNIPFDVTGNFAVGNPMSMIDNSTLTVQRLVNSTANPISMIDDPTFNIFDNVEGNPMSMIDNATLSVNFFGNFTVGNPISMIDNATFTQNVFGNFTVGNPISMIDDPTFNIFDNVVGNPMSMIDNATLSVNFFGNFTADNPMSLIDNATFKIFDNVIGNPMSMIDDPFFNIFDSIVGNPMSMVDSVQLQIIFFVAPPDVVVTTGGGGVGIGGQPVSSQVDSDDDGILDDVDDCPFEAETFNGFDDTDGCPDVIDLPEPITVADLGFPFGFNELSVIDDFVNLETDSPQPQVEDLGIRWLGDEPITITAIIVEASPFEFQFENLPAEFGNNQIGFTQGQIIYTIQEPNKECTDVFSFDCVDNVTYDIPVTIQGEVRGKIVTAQGSIIVDNSDRFNPYWMVFIFMAMIIILALVFWRRKRNSAPPSTRTLLKVTQAKSTGRITETKKVSRTGKGETRRILEGKEKKKFLFKRR